MPRRAVLVVIHPGDISFLLHPFGLCPGTPHQQTLCKGYNSWSGILSDIGEITLLGIAFGAWRHINCHVRGCPRIGRHPVGGTPYKVCRIHHPDVPNKGATVEHIHEIHRRHKEGAGDT